MLLFEILGRRKNLDPKQSESKEWFPRWVWEKIEKGDMESILSLSGISEEDRERGERMCKVALWCVQYEAEARPSMSSVVRMLEGRLMIAPPLNPFLYLTQSEVLVNSDQWTGTATNDLTWTGTATNDLTSKGTSKDQRGTVGRCCGANLQGIGLRSAVLTKRALVSDWAIDDKPMYCFRPIVASQSGEIIDKSHQTFGAEIIDITENRTVDDEKMIGLHDRCVIFLYASTKHREFTMNLPLGPPVTSRDGAFQPASDNELVDCDAIASNVD
ncbi:G-type lectin S-receptor-like serine/threonine-protein kinase SD2-5 [Ananas comosus]|uniref:G-type lectin S-receptor-like serine/threonine-protein kinase SD2-5 n=1 Tax=Ananas comosus TaxID=4615 RepID=A0A199UT79_ANACO|nr:G-type lectin S-receptor-like serine/threonine-protein kinase SD2-5 [Ananas comosus]